MNKLEEIKKMSEKITKENQPAETKSPKKEVIFHVSCNSNNNVIYAGTVNKKGNKWLKQTDVTQEAIAAVRDHFMNVKSMQEEDTDIVGYQWKTADGRSITLQLVIEENPTESSET
jgi:hypothetical protein